MQSEQNAATGASDTEGQFERRALVAGGATHTVFADGSYTLWVPRTPSELAALMA